MATTYDVRPSTHGSRGAMTSQRLEILEGVYDGAVRNLAIDDSVIVVTIPANFLVLSVVHKVLTVDGAGITFDIGDSATPALYGDNIAGDAETHAALITNRKFYSTADYAKLLINTVAADTLKVLVQVVGINMAGLKDSAKYAGVLGAVAV